MFVFLTSIFPSSGISGFLSLRYWKYPYYRSIVSFRFDIVAIATNTAPLKWQPLVIFFNVHTQPNTLDTISTSDTAATAAAAAVAVQEAARNAVRCCPRGGPQRRPLLRPATPPAVTHASEFLVAHYTSKKTPPFSRSKRCYRFFKI